MNEQRMKPSDNVLIQKVAHEAVLLDLDSQSYFGLDELGTMIWDAVSDGKTQTEIVARIIEEFEVNAEIARRDLKIFLERLAADKLITFDQK